MVEKIPVSSCWLSTLSVPFFYSFEQTPPGHIPCFLSLKMVMATAAKKAASRRRTSAKKATTKLSSTKGSTTKKGATKKNKLGVKNLLVNNINAHKKKGDSKSRKKVHGQQGILRKDGTKLGEG
jgi:hypothetical protein